MLLIGFAIGIGVVVILFFVLLLAAMLGIPLETRKAREKRAAIAWHMQQQAIQSQAARNLQVREAEARLRGEQF